MVTADNALKYKVVARIADIDAQGWDACANNACAINARVDDLGTRAACTDGADVDDSAANDAGASPLSAPADPVPFDPFVSHAFLLALEQSGSVSGHTGWAPQHLVIEAAQVDGAGRGGGGILGCMPCYLKSHSQGEYVFDHGWAEAFTRAGGVYYPKLQCAVPFTPVPGRRFLTRAATDEDKTRKALARAAIQLARSHDASSLHITFASHLEWSQLGTPGDGGARALLQRTHSQFHWQNDGYGSFDEFLATLASRKRKAMRKERREALSAGITIRHLSGKDIKEHHWDQFFEFYLDTSNRKWGTPYLNREFFSLLGQAMSERCLLIFCERGGQTIAGALNLLGGDCLYGRYWGAKEHHPCLHFEVCYYQAIDIAIERGLARVEAGAQGEHKLARGYTPVPTYSLHWIADPNFRAAVAQYLSRERRHAALEREALATFTPFKKSC